MAKRNIENRERNENKSTSGEQMPARRSSMGVSPFSMHPFGLLRRFANEIDSLFDDFSFGRDWPQLDILEQEGHIVIRADMPGMKKEDIQVEVDDGGLRITGERKDEREEREGEYYRAERSYGRFERRIPLPEGVNPDDIGCTFKEGVLEIRMKAPEHVEKRGRRLEIKDSGKEDKAA